MLKQDKNTNEIMLEVYNPVKALRDARTLINQLIVEKGNRNLTGAKLAELSDALDKAIKNALYLTIGAIQTGIITKDEYGYLRAKVTSKKFKDPVYVNRKLREFIKLNKEATIGDREVSDVEIAKLMETPYKTVNPDDVKDISVEEAVEISKGTPSEEELKSKAKPIANDYSVIHVVQANGESVYIDKNDRTVFANGKWRLMKQTVGSWYEIAKGAITRIFGKVWEYFIRTAMTIIKAALYVLTAIAAFVTGLGLGGVAVAEGLHNQHSKAEGWFKRTFGYDKRLSWI